MIDRRGCLGDVAAALVDGQLDHGARDRALAHLAHCTSCRAEVDAQRRLKARLSGLEAPALPPSLQERLLALPYTTEATGGAGGPAPSQRADEVARPRGAARGSARPGRRRTRVARRVAGGAVALGLGAALVLGGEPSAAPPAVGPESPELVVDHARTTGQVPLQDLPAVLTRGPGAR